MIFMCAISLPVQGFCYYRLYYCGSFLSGMNMSQAVLFTCFGTSIDGPVGLEEGGVYHQRNNQCFALLDLPFLFITLQRAYSHVSETKQSLACTTELHFPNRRT